MDGKNTAIGPIQREQTAAITFRKIAVRPEFNTRGRTDTDINDGRKAVRIIGGPFRAAGAPAKFRGEDAVADARRPIPWQAPIPFHVAIERKQLTLRAEIEIVSVAEPRQPEAPTGSVWVGAQDVAARGEDADGMTVRIPLARQH